MERLRLDTGINPKKKWKARPVNPKGVKPLDGEIYAPTTRMPVIVRKGRPSLFKEEYCLQAAKLCSLGATDIEVADFFQISHDTLQNWKATYTQFNKAMRVGKDSCDARVERSLYLRAVGYTFDAVKIFLPKDSTNPVMVPYREHVPPDTTACIFWLKNRQSDKWRDVAYAKFSGQVKLSITPDEAKL